MWSKRIKGKTIKNEATKSQKKITDKQLFLYVFFVSEKQQHKEKCKKINT